MKYLLLILFIFFQYEYGWILITPNEDYFATWLETDTLGAMWIERNTNLSTCLIIKNGKENECTLQQFSILMNRFPREIIEDLKL